jgi:hypothetical protein
MRDGAPPRPGVEVHAEEAEGGRDERRRRLSVGTKSLSVQEDLCVELAGSPAVQDLPERRVVDAEKRRDHGEVGRERDDRPDVQVAVRPAVAPASDPGSEGVVHGGMAEAALNADGRERLFLSKKPVSPTTELNLRSASVVAGSSRFTFPAFSCETRAGGRASASTLRPTERAVLGLTPANVRVRLRRAKGLIGKRLLKRVGAVSPDAFRFGDEDCARLTASVLRRRRSFA